MIRPTFETFNQDWADRMIGRVGKKGIDSYLGLKITEVEAGRLVCEMPVTDEVITMIGNMHGGCLSALCDHV
ncbi:MAG: phenylacetic acid degradation protein, partial [Pseudomonadota bacterium]